ncbi:hypothetical protein C0995_016675 [Termitomyces sp. Mi166|nr:hypothetical protein C0995_016675 [Termitomyces sp. Mi166\
MYYPFTRTLINGARRFQFDGMSSAIPPEGFFQHTFGRWAVNEDFQLRRRYLKFDIDALKAADVSAVNGAKSVTEMTKFHETDFSKVFSFTLDNGQKVMARLPTSMAGPARLVTQSQVATSEFARQRLGIPVPRTLAWCADRDQTDVGAEFIIEEAPSGVELSPEGWSELSLAERLDATREVWKIEKKMLDNPLPAYGSIFFREDAQSLENCVEVDEEFAVGPSMDTSFWADERASMDIKRGPWTDPYQLLFDITGQAHLEALVLFSGVLSCAVPKKVFTQSTLAHPLGLDGANVWISESALAEDRIEITAITDWQHAMASPLYQLGGLPAVIDLGNFQNENLTMTLADDKVDIKGKTSYESEQCIAEYDRLAKAEVFSYFQVKTDEELQLYATIARSAARVWGRSLHRLRVKTYRIQRMLPELEFPDPYYISNEKVEMWQAEGREWKSHWGVVRYIMMQILVLNEDGWTHPGQYDAACEAYAEIKKI